MPHPWAQANSRHFSVVVQISGRQLLLPSLGTVWSPPFSWTPQNIPGDNITAILHVCVSPHGLQGALAGLSLGCNKAEAVALIAQVRKLRLEDCSEPRMANTPGRCWNKTGPLASRHLHWPPPTVKVLAAWEKEGRLRSGGPHKT